MNVVADGLYRVSSVLLAPVVALLLLLLGLVLLQVGRFLREALERRRDRERRDALRGALVSSGPEHGAALDRFFAAPAGEGLLERFAREGGAVHESPRHLEALLGGCEVAAAAAVARTAFLGRAGPILGLMGTLIPMGPALVSLSQGDVAEMSRSLVVAFTTTVVGLLVGLLAMAVSTVRRHWYAADLALLEHVVACRDATSSEGARG